MKSSPVHERRRGGVRLCLLAIASAVVLAACGGGSSSDQSSSLQLGGVVVDGPIQGAAVFLDLNNNRVRDGDEPISLPTDAQGAFSLVAQRLTQAQLATAMLVTHVADTARDADDSGLTLAQAGRSGLTLMTPAAAYVHVDAAGANSASPVVVSPLTTMVAGEMSINGLTLAQARAAVQANLALGDKDPMANFVAGGDAGMGNIARAAATALGEAGRSVAELARTHGGVAVHEQIAEIVETVRQQMPSMIHDLGLDRPGAPRPSVPTMMAALKSASGTGASDTSGSTRQAKQVPADAEQRFVVVLRASVADPAATAASLMQGRAGRIAFTYAHAIKGFAVALPSSAAAAFVDAMNQNANVDHVEVDQAMSASQTLQSPATWGLDRADQRNLPLDSGYSYTVSGIGVTAYVIDTGIRADHVDFGGRVGPGYTSIADANGTSDCNGHGTHVSGTIGGATYGIAKSVRLVPVRVLDCTGSGTVSTVTAGIDWVIANAARPAVINMSLGGGASSAIDTAVANAVNAGVTVVVAAGNSSANACNYSPARAPAAITVGATTSSDAQASYSNFGSCLDLYAPGTGITSDWFNSPTATGTTSGTSMASPHVAGLAALVLQSSPAASPGQVTDAIKAGATANVLTSVGSGSPNLLLFTGAADTGTPPPPPPPPPSATTVWVGALTGNAALLRNGWRATATITVVSDTTGTPVAGAVVTGGFSVGGTGKTCTTGATGFCSIASGTISKKFTQTTFTINGISGTGLAYDATKNSTSSVAIARP